ncbi:hypothetical protein LINGRAHAP2_LOCUS28729 [Linum grandiflorum]
MFIERAIMQLTTLLVLGTRCLLCIIFLFMIHCWPIGRIMIYLVFPRQD